MLKFLLDEHISPEVGLGLRARNKSIHVHWTLEWQEGSWLGADDFRVLEEAASQKLTLVTYDRKTIPPILKAWAEAGLDHGGVIFVDEKSIPPSDIGALIRALLELWKKEGTSGWTNRVHYLKKG